MAIGIGIGTWRTPRRRSGLGAAPTNFAATPVGDSGAGIKVSLAVDHVVDSDGYNFYRALGNGDFSLLYHGPNSASQNVDDVTVATNTVYRYYATVIRGGVEGLPSAILTVLTHPAAPVLNATADALGNHLTWTTPDSGNGLGFFDASNGFGSIGSGLSYDYNNYPGQGSVTYNIVARNATGDSANSNSVMVNIPDVAPAPSFMFNGFSDSGSSWDYSWSLSGGGDAGYVVTSGAIGGNCPDATSVGFVAVGNSTFWGITGAGSTSDNHTSPSH
jgi:hypothetical protein